jgi:hypothetical protein
MREVRDLDASAFRHAPLADDRAVSGDATGSSSTLAVMGPTLQIAGSPDRKRLLNDVLGGGQDTVLPLSAFRSGSYNHQKPGTNRSATAAYSVPSLRKGADWLPTNPSRGLSWAATNVRLIRVVTPMAAHAVLGP